MTLYGCVGVFCWGGLVPVTESLRWTMCVLVQAPSLFQVLVSRKLNCSRSSDDLANAPIGFITIRLEHKRLPGCFRIHGYCFASNFTPSCPEGTSPRFLYLFASGVPPVSTGVPWCPPVSPCVPAEHLKSLLFVPVQVLCRESSGMLKAESKKPKVSQVDLL